MIKKGETAARTQWNELMEIKRQAGGRHRKDIQTILQRKTDTLHIKSIEIKGLTTYSKDWFKNVAGLKEENTLLTLLPIEKGINNLKRTGIFASLSYRILEEGKLVYYATEAHQSTFNTTINLNNEDIASVLLNTQLKLDIYKTYNLSVSARVNRSPWSDFNYFYYLSPTHFIGGEWANQHVFSSIPIQGTHFTEIASDLIMDSSIQLQYHIAQKHFLSLSGSCIYHTKDTDNFWKGNSSYDIALKYIYDSFAGPMKLSLDYSGYTRDFGIYVSIGHAYREFSPPRFTPIPAFIQKVPIHEYQATLTSPLNNLS